MVAGLDILRSGLHRRGVDLKALSIGEPQAAAGGTLRQRIAVRNRIPIEKALERRVQTHIFLCVLAYHLLVGIEKLG